MKKSSIIQVNPFSLEKVALDTSGLTVLRSSVEAAGRIIEPIHVWRDKHGLLHVSDGFHRAEIARQLNWKSIDALEIFCTEDEFWHLRITNAVGHRTITGDRINDWIYQAWLASGFEASAELLDAAFTVQKKLRGSAKNRKFKDSQQRLYEFFVSRARSWQMPTDELISIILRKAGLTDPGNQMIDLAVRKDLEFKEYQALAESYASDTDARLKGIAPRNLDTWADHVLDTGEVVKPTEFSNRPKRTVTPVVDPLAEKIIQAKISLDALLPMRHRIADLINSGVLIGELAEKSPSAQNSILALLKAADDLATWAGIAQKHPEVALLEENAKLIREIDLLRKEKMANSITPDKLALSSSQL